MNRIAPRLLAAVLLAAAIPGCRTAGSAAPPPDPAPAPVTVDEAARSLGLRVAESNRDHAVLRDGTNTVSIFCPPARWIYVNGEPAVPVEGVRSTGDGLLVPRAAVARIRDALPPPAPPTPTPEPPKPPAKPATPPPPPPEPAPVRDLASFEVVVDPGHGGRDPGATSVTGAHEKRITLAVGRLLAARLEARGAKVTLTRADDRYVGLPVRAAVANRAKADLFVSVHADSARNASARGFSVYAARRASAESLAAARAILAALPATGLPSRGLRRGDFQVLVLTKGPAVLVEMGFLSNRTDAKILVMPSEQGRFADAIAEGIGKALLAR